MSAIWNRTISLLVAISCLVAACVHPVAAHMLKRQLSDSSSHHSMVGKHSIRARAVQLYNDAVEYFKREQAAEAIAGFQAALKLDSSLQTVHGPIGELMFSSGNYQEAYRQLDMATAVEPGNSIYWCLLGITSARIRQYEAAEKAFEEYLRLDPNGSYAPEAKRSMAIMSNANAIGQIADASNYLHRYLKGSRRWLPDGRALKVFVAGGSGVVGFKPIYQEIVQNAFDQWTVVSEGRLRFELVNDPKQAQICCAWTADRAELMHAGELGETTLTFNREGNIQHASIKLSTTFNDAPSAEDVLRRAQSVALHEIGHALGLEHSNLPWDIMYPTVAPLGLEFSPSSRDKNTLLALYSG